VNQPDSSANSSRFDEFITALETIGTTPGARASNGTPDGLCTKLVVCIRSSIRALPYEVAGRSEEAIYFLVATLYPLADSRNDQRSLGAILRAVRQSRASESIDRRFQALLDSNSENLPFRLRQAVRLAAASDQSIDWRRLLNDLLNWDHPDRYVQLQWARDYFTDHS
jgi:CRISPR system Cascade subunit CasB